MRRGSPTTSAPTSRCTSPPSTPTSRCATSRHAAGHAHPGPAIAPRNGLRYVYTGNVHDADGSSTCCPGCGGRVVDADWYDSAPGTSPTTALPDCGTAIPGRFDGPPGAWGLLWGGGGGGGGRGGPGRGPGAPGRGGGGRAGGGAGGGGCSPGRREPTRVAALIADASAPPDLHDAEAIIAAHAGYRYSGPPRPPPTGRGRPPARAAPVVVWPAPPRLPVGGTGGGQHRRRAGDTARRRSPSTPRPPPAGGRRPGRRGRRRPRPRAQRRGAAAVRAGAAGRRARAAPRRGPPPRRTWPPPSRPCGAATRPCWWRRPTSATTRTTSPPRPRRAQATAILEGRAGDVGPQDACGCLAIQGLLLAATGGPGAPPARPHHLGPHQRRRRTGGRLRGLRLRPPSRWPTPSVAGSWRSPGGPSSTS